MPDERHLSQNNPASPQRTPITPEDERYLLLLIKPLEVCTYYRPKFGQGGKGLSVEEFRHLYSTDSFYHWIGLDSSLMYSAHKVAGGMTSIYRQLGIGVQWIFSQIIQDYLGLTEEEASWSYQVPSAKIERQRTLSLDGRIDLSHIRNEEAKIRVTL